MSRGYIDADGHIMEKAKEFFEYFEEPWRSCDTLTPSRVVNHAHFKVFLRPVRELSV